MMKLGVLAVAGLGLLAAGCTESAQMCSFERAMYNSFSALAAEGEFTAAQVQNVNAFHKGATVVCANPTASTPEEVLATATTAYIVIKRAMEGSDQVRTVMYPHMRNLERFLKESRR